MPIRIHHAFFIGLLVGFCTNQASAQYDPGATGAYGAGLGRIALSQSVLSGTANPGADNDSGPSETMRNYCRTRPEEKTCIKLGLGSAGQVADLDFAELDRALAETVQQNGDSSAAGSGDISLDRLSYHPSQPISQRVRQVLSQRLTAAAPKPAKRSIQQLLSSDGILRAYRSIMDGYELDSSNVANAMALRYVIFWQLANDYKIDDPVAPSQIRGVRDQMKNLLAEHMNLQDASPEELQSMVESTAMITVLIAASASKERERGNSAVLAQFQDEVHSSSLNQGLDLRRLRLTERGFVTSREN